MTNFPKFQLYFLPLGFHHLLGDKSFVLSISPPHLLHPPSQSISQYSVRLVKVYSVLPFRTVLLLQALPYCLEQQEHHDNIEKGMMAVALAVLVLMLLMLLVMTMIVMATIPI